jgi:hypothetical protein
MKHRNVALSVCVAVAAAFALTGVLAGQESQLQKFQEVSLTGCLVQGTGPNVFILENAKADPRDTSQKGRSYLLDSGTASISFREHLNNEVLVDGEAEMKTPPAVPAGQRVKESDLPKLKAAKIEHVAETCSSPLQ